MLLEVLSVIKEYFENIQLYSNSVKAPLYFFFKAFKYWPCIFVKLIICLLTHMEGDSFQ